MQILTAEEIRAWDQYTIQHEPIASINLMERAARACCDWILAQNFPGNQFVIFCGKGNNGGDGLAIARMLMQQGQKVQVYILEFGAKGTEDFQLNLERLHEMNGDMRFISTVDTIPSIDPQSIVIDALLGTGLNRPIEGLTRELVQSINQSATLVISIDIPSGLSADSSSKGHSSIHAKHTLSFQVYKQAFLVAENADAVGQVHILDIGLHPAFPGMDNRIHVVTPELIRSIYKPRKAFAHKGDFGHAMLVAGSYGKMGAAVLAAKACIHGGTGLLSVQIPRCGYEIMQVAVPEAIVLQGDGEEKITTYTDVAKYAATGIGPGLGQDDETAKVVERICNEHSSPLVIDADALNILAKNQGWFGKLYSPTILTPHPKEFSRLFGDTADDFAQRKLAVEKARELGITIVLKGRYTLIATPGGLTYYNLTGNPGMASGGTGDVLTGLITALCAQGYPAHHAAILGVYIHGLAGDLALERESMESLSAGLLIDYFGPAFNYSMMDY